jgi:hypothetical protein
MEAHYTKITWANSQLNSINDKLKLFRECDEETEIGEDKLL